jgi:prepilin-type N-terminal cleavage/methylation domain-containing protein
MRPETNGFTPLEIKISNGRSKKFLTGFTLVELLAVLGIIAILVSLLIPALTMVRKMAKETQQKAQITTIELAIVAFKNDYGDYPRSQGVNGTGMDDYSGAQMLAEALVGWDLMGFHPKSAWRADGYDKDGGRLTYDPAKSRDDNSDGTPDTLKERVGPYLELATANAFRLEQLFDDTGTLKKKTFVLCDVFGKKSVTIGGKAVKAGAPILYYRANTSSKTLEATYRKDRIYNVYDNDTLVYAKQMEDGVTHPLAGPDTFFYKYIKDPKVTTVKWPCRPDSYILISAGADGLYGTRDDICNFEPNLPG